MGNTDNAGNPAGDGIIDASDDCTLVGFDGTPDGVEIVVTDGSFETGPIERQAEVTFDNLRRIVTAAGGTMDDVTQVLIYLTDPAAFDGMNEVYRRFFDPPYPNRATVVVAGFIAFCAVVFVVIGQAPVKLLVLAGALNGLILPVGLAVLLWVAARRSGDLLSGYRYPRWLLVIGVAVWLLTVYLGWESLGGIADLWE